MFTPILFTVQSSRKKRTHKFFNLGRFLLSPFVLKSSNCPWKGCISLIMCHTISGRFWSRTGGFLSSAWAPQGKRAFSSELQSLHLHQASSLNPEAAGTRRGQPSRPPPGQAPPAEASQTSPPPSHNCQQGSPAHTCRGGLHTRPPPASSPPVPPAPEPGSTGWHTDPMWDGGSRK